MQSGNGIDLAAVYQLLTEVARRIGAVETTLGSHTEKLNELAAVVNQHGRKIDDLAAGLTELRLTVHQYHSAVIGQGIKLTQLGERIKRIEAHLNLDFAPS